jgi:anti-sigma factor RsiW
MTWPHAEDGSGPGPELLAAYLDGELQGNAERLAQKEQVEAWLAEHPEAAAEPAAGDGLRTAWQATAPAEPGENAWDAVRVCVQDQLDREKERRARRRILAWGAGGAAAAAVAAWLLLTLPSSGPAPQVVERSRPIPAKNVEEEAPFPVATADEVEIVHIQGNDTATLVVGALPLEGPLVLAGHGDVTLKSVQPAPPDNMVPNVLLSGPTPMIWAPLARERP